MNTIISDIVSTASKHIGDKFLKEIYALSLLTPGVLNVEEPVHIFIYGSPEVGKTALQTIFMELVPKEHKDIASDFTPKVLMYSNLQPATIVSINDKILNDSIGSILNQVADNSAWHKGKIIATTVGADRVNLVFPPRCVFWINANKHIMEYNLREVDPLALVGRFMIFEKTYSDKQKKEIFLKRNKDIEEDNKDKIEKIRKYINDIYEHPKVIKCSEECRNLIWEKSVEVGISSLRSIGRNLSLCQVIALTNNRTEVTKDDIETIFALLKTEEKPIKNNETQEEIQHMETEILKNMNLVEKYLESENRFKKLEPKNKLKYSLESIKNKFNTFNVIDMIMTMEEGKMINHEEVILILGDDKVVTNCYYLVKNQII